MYCLYLLHLLVQMATFQAINGKYAIRISFYLTQTENVEKDNVQVLVKFSIYNSKHYTGKMICV